MHDMQNQRLRHLLVNAIIDLWKKETGSLSSVVIEGTICITSGAGKTTVLQVCDRFTGGMRESEDERRHHPGRRSVGPYQADRYGNNLPLGLGFLSPTRYTDVPRVETNPAAMAAMLDHLSPASLVSPITDYSRSGRESRSPSMPPPQDYPIDVSGYSAKNTADAGSRGGSPVKEEKVSGENGIGAQTFVGRDPFRESMENEEEEATKRDVTTPSNTVSNGPVEMMDGAQTDHNRNSIESKPVDEMESPKTSNSGSEKPAKRLDFNSVDAVSTPASSAAISVIHSPLSTAKDNELALSPPQNYTAQIRDVIRQRLLASRSVSQSEEDREGSENAQDLSCISSRSLIEREQFNASISELEHDRDRQRKHELDMLRESIREGRPHSRHEIERPSSRERSRSREDDRQRSRSVEERSTSASPRLMVGGYAPPPHPHLPPHHPFTISSFVAQLPKSAIMSGHFLPHPGLPQLISTPSPQTPYKLSDIMRMRPDQTPPSGVPLMYSHAAPPMLMPREDARLNSTSSNSSNGSPRMESGGESSPTNKENSGDAQHIYKCDYCNKTFLFKSKYHEHLPVHTNARPYQCHLCNRTYKYKYDLRVHLRTHMGIPTKSTICPFCNAKFDTNKQLRNHIKMGHSDQQKASPQDCTQPVDNLPPAL